jgi:hypothetical protein
MTSNTSSALTLAGFDARQAVRKGRGIEESPARAKRAVSGQVARVADQAGIPRAVDKRHARQLVEIVRYQERLYIDRHQRVRKSATAKAGVRTTIARLAVAPNGPNGRAVPIEGDTLSRHIYRRIRLCSERDPPGIQ